nr:hypothetical protein [uncultured Trichococcus sp.]
MEMIVKIELNELFEDMLSEVETEGEYGYVYVPEPGVENRIKEKVISELMGNLASKLKNSLGTDLEKKMKDTLDEKIETELKPQVDSYLKEFLNTKRVVINSTWKDPQEYSTLEYIGLQVDKMLNEQVEIDRYDRKKDTRINYLLDSMVKKIVEEKFEKIKVEQTKKITKALENAIASQAKDSVLKGLDLEKIASAALETEEK